MKKNKLMALVMSVLMLGSQFQVYAETGYPSAIDTDAELLNTANNNETQLATSTDADDTTITVDNTTGFPSTYGTVQIENEVIYYTGKDSNNFTGCTRGYDNTSAVSHANDTPVYGSIVSAHHEYLKNAIIALETALGINPEGAYTDVVSRLNSLPTSILEGLAIDISGTNGDVTISVDLSEVDTDSLPEGATNLYCTDTNIKTALSDDFHNIGGTDTDTTYTAGTGMELVGTTFNCTIVDTDTTYTAGTGMELSGTTFNCTVVDTNTEYSAGHGLDLTDTQFSVVDADLTLTSGQVSDFDAQVTSLLTDENIPDDLTISTDKTITAGAFVGDGSGLTGVGGDVSSVNAGAGIEITSTTGDVTITCTVVDTNTEYSNGHALSLTGTEFAVIDGDITITTGQISDYVAPSGTVDRLLAGGVTSVGTSSTWDISDSVIMQYKMNDNAGSTAVDDSMDAFEGTAQRNTSLMSTTGKISSAFDFDGSNDYIDLGTGAFDTQMEGDFSIYGWFKEGEVTGYEYIVNKQNSGSTDEGLIIFFSPSNDKFYAQICLPDDSTPYVISDSALDDGSWHFFVAMRDGDNLKLYIDNVLQGSPTGSSTGDISNALHMWIGCDDDGTSKYNGLLDNLTFVGRVLTTDEMTGLYNSGNGTEALSVTAMTELNAIGSSSNVTPQYVSDDGGNLYIEKALEIGTTFYASKIRSLPLDEITTAQAGNNTIFVDSADHLLKYKDDSGDLFAITTSAY